MFFDEITKLESNSGSSNNTPYICIPDLDKSTYSNRWYGFTEDIPQIVCELYLEDNVFTDSELTCKYIFIPIYLENVAGKTIGPDTVLSIRCGSSAIAPTYYPFTLYLKDLYTIPNSNFYILLDTTYGNAYVIG